MAVIDLEALLRPVSDEAPAGVNLEYDLAFAELERTARWTEERQSGDQVIAPEAPVWRDVKPQALALFERTRDLRVAVHLAQALAAVDGLAGFADGIRLIHRLLDQFWDTVYPRLDPDEHNDSVFRVNCLAQLADPGRTLKVLRSAVLVEARGVGRFTLRDLMVAEGLLTPAGDDAARPRSLLDGALNEAGVEFARAQQAHAAGIIADLAAINTVFQKRGEATVYPDLDALDKLFTPVRAFFDAGVAAASSEGTGNADADAGDAGAARRTGTTAVAGIQTREDVKRMLAEVCAWIRRNEPGHPAPLLIERGSRLLDMNFLEIVQDLAPSGVHEVHQNAGTKPSE